MNKIAYSVIHIKDDSEQSKKRSQFVNEIHTIINDNFIYLDFKPYKISNQDSLLEYKKINKDLKVLSNLKYGEIGCIVSHYEAWKNFVKTDNDYLLILEDDAKMLDNAIENIHKYLEETPKDFDVLSLFSHGKREVFDINKHSINRQNIVKLFQSESTMAYIISKKGAMSYINLFNRGITNPVDLFLFKNNINQQNYAIHPNSEKVFSSEHAYDDNGISFAEDTLIQNTNRIGNIVSKTVHQILILENMKDICDSLVNYNKQHFGLVAPGYAYYCWTENEIEKFLINNFNDNILNVFKSLKLSKHKTDFASLCILYIYGGWYADFSAQVFYIPEIATNAILFEDKQNTTGSNNTISNSLIYSNPGNLFLLESINRMCDNIKNNDLDSESFIDGKTLLWSVVFSIEPGYINAHIGYFEKSESSSDFGYYCLNNGKTVGVAKNSIVLNVSEYQKHIEVFNNKEKCGE